VKKLTEVLQSAVNGILQVANDIKPFLPQTAEKIENQFNKQNVTSQSSLFPRI